MEGLQNFVYLGSTINSADDSRSLQLRRIGIAAGNMNNLECIWRQPHLLATKLRLYMTLIAPMLLYASETWTLTKADLNHLQAFRVCCRDLPSVCASWFQKIKKADITRHTCLPHIGNLIQKRRHSLFGHVARMHPFPQGPGSSNPQALQGYFNGPPSYTRLEKAPRPTWSDQLKKDRWKPASTLCTRAQDRWLWRRDATALPGYAT